MTAGINDISEYGGPARPKAQTAFQLGFEYPQYFTRLFKSKTGQTPAAYRFLAQ